MWNKTVFLILLLFIFIIIVPIIMVGSLFWNSNDQMLIKVYNHQSDKIVVMQLEEYLRGVVAAEMPAAYSIEALKAQAVAARTYTLKQLPQFGGPGCQEHSEADISTDFKNNQAWLSKKDMQEKWGFTPYFYYWARVSGAVKQTRGEILLYNGRIIDAVYHANSGGFTENAVNVWGKKVPYLTTVKSSYDREASQNLYFGISQIIKKLNLNLNKADFKITIIEKSKSGRVLKMKIGKQLYSGTDIRQKLNLPSTKFDISSQSDIITFHIQGKGHGVGMSQDGANGMAKAGYTYHQILKHYYPGTKITDIGEVKK
ncbi:MAG: stage II sporulation protein D [Halothermotrichaceae bacterium]